MISGTSIIPPNLDPIIGQNWTRGPRIYRPNPAKNIRELIETFQNISFSYGNILENYYFHVNFLEIRTFSNYGHHRTLTNHFFETLEFPRNH